MGKLRVVPNCLTAVSLLLGLLVSFKTLFIEEEALSVWLIQSVVLLLFAAIFDVADGFAARLLSAETAFGINFDSIADAISFGLTPSILLLRITATSPGTIEHFLMMGATLLFSLSGILRLVRYNVKKQEEPSEDELLLRKYLFTGLPIPAAAFGALSMLLSLKPPFSLAKTFYLALSLIFLSYLMISIRKFPSLRTFSFHLSQFRTIFLLSVFFLSSIHALLNNFSIVFLFLSWGYIGLGLIYSIIRDRRLKRRGSDATV